MQQHSVRRVACITTLIENRSKVSSSLLRLFLIFGVQPCLAFVGHRDAIKHVFLPAAPYFHCVRWSFTPLWSSLSIQIWPIYWSYWSCGDLLCCLGEEAYTLGRKIASILVNGMIFLQVIGASGSLYTCFTSCHYCPCPAFAYTVLRRNEGLLVRISTGRQTFMSNTHVIYITGRSSSHLFFF